VLRKGHSRCGLDRIDTDPRRGKTRLVADVDGYQVVTTEGKSVGRVVGESERVFVVEGGTWPRKACHAVPKASASVNTDENRVVIQVSKAILMQSPKLRRGDQVDEDALAAWWGLD
jgi:hypothetical protein